MASLELKGIRGTSTVFGIEDALTAYGSDLSSGILYTQGCAAQGAWNCTDACQDPDQIFSNPYTFQNCMVLLALTPNPFSPMTDLSTEAIEVANQFGIDTRDPGFPSVARNTNQTIQDCLIEYCASFPGCFYFNKYHAWYFAPELYGAYENASVPAYADVCGSEEAGPLNAEIGGIGIYLSYWMQSIITCFASCLLKVSTHKRRTRGRQHRISSATETASIEFHKAQCFFILAITTAALITVRQGSLNHDIITLQGLFNNYSFIGIISMGGFIPVTFVLFALHSVGMRSWYILILSTLAVTMSTITMFSVGDFHLSPADLQQLKDATTDKYPKCGSRNPTTFCVKHGHDLTSFASFSVPFGIGGPGLVISLLILTLLILDYCGVRRCPIYNKYSQWLSDIPVRLITPFLPIKYRRYVAFMPNVVIKMTSYLVCIGYLVLNCFLLVNLGLPSNGARIDPVNTWTFAQIVAITVWAGPIFEFVKISIQGLEKGISYRMPYSYKVIQHHEAPFHSIRKHHPTNQDRNQDLAAPPLQTESHTKHTAESSIPMMKAPSTTDLDTATSTRFDSRAQSESSLPRQQPTTPSR